MDVPAQAQNCQVWKGTPSGAVQAAICAVGATQLTSATSVELKTVCPEGLSGLTPVDSLSAAPVSSCANARSSRIHSGAGTLSRHSCSSRFSGSFINGGRLML